MAVNYRAPSLDLAKARETQGISLEQIADKTKISMRFLRAIEAEEFDKLPGGIFSTSYLRLYAGIIGYEEAALLALYNSLMRPEDPQHAGSANRDNRPAAKGTASWQQGTPAPLF